MLSFKNHIVEQQELQEKLLLINKGARYGQIVILAGGAGCFSADTLVHTESGHTPISDIKEGDLVWTTNEDTGNEELKEVEDTHSFEANPEPMLELEFDNGEIVKCTANHEFFIEGEWVQAKDIPIA